MGCAPSHSEIIQHLAKNTLRPLKKSTAQGSADRTHTETQTHSVSGGSGNSDSDSFENGQENAIQLRGEEDQHNTERSYCQKLPDLAVPARTPKLYNEETKREELAAGTKVAVSEVTVSQKYVPWEFAEQKQHPQSDSNSAQQPRRSRKQKCRQTPTQVRRTKQREKSRSRSVDEEKVDFPTSMVNAHQAVYAYLNPSLSKYDAVLRLIEQAAQTQLILQQMVSFLTLRFEEVNCILQEIAGEGERLVKDVGAQLAWPAGIGAPQEQPDLLQQLLLYTVNKMQATNGTVTSLTTSALQEACTYLHSAKDTLQNKLMVKQGVDERLQKMIVQLEACARQQPHSKPRDQALHSEDSGIGGETDSMKEYWNPEKCGRCTSSDSNAHLLSRDSHPHPSRIQETLSHITVCTSKSYDTAVDHQLKGTFYSTHEEKVSSSASVSTSQYAQIQNRSFSSFESLMSTDCEAFIRTESMDFCSLGEDEEEETISDIIVNGTPQRPWSSPPESEAVWSIPKRMDIPENEEMTIKMKDAISGKIQFVPINPGSNAWSDEEGKLRPVRPSTAKGGKTRVVKKRRSKSAESLKSKAEDPTLLELQRTQKDLSRRLEKMLQPKSENSKGGFEQRKMLAMPKLPTSLPGTGQTVPSNKLKASLHSNFSILPSQEKMHLRKIPAGSCYQTQTQNQIDTQIQALQTQNQNHTQAQTQDQIQNHAHMQSEDQAQDQSQESQTQTQTGAQVLAEEKQVMSCPTAIRKQRTGVQGLITTFSQRSAGLTTRDAPLPPPTLDLETRSRVAGLGPAPAPAGTSGRGPVTSSSHKLQAGDQPWPQYKIINLRYAGAFCSPQENGTTERPPKASRPGPSTEREAEANSSIDEAAAPAKLSQHFSTFQSCRAEAGSPAPSPSPPDSKKAFLTTTLPSRNLYLPVGYTTPSASRKRWPNMIWGSEQPNLPATQDELSSPVSPPPVSVKPPGLATGILPSSLTTGTLPPRHPVHHQLPSPPVHRQTPNPPVHRQLPSPPVHRQTPSPPVHRQPPSPPVHRQPPSPPVHRQTPSPPVHHQPPSPPVHRQLPSPPVHRQPPSPLVHRQLPSPPVHCQPPESSVHRQPPSPPVHRQLPSPPVHRQIPSPPVHRQLPSPPTAINSVPLQKRPLDRTEKPGSNASSIFCPLSDSIFESQPPSPLVDRVNTAAQLQSIISGDISPLTSRVAWKNNFTVRQPSDRPRRLTLSGVHPQPFVKKNHLLDFKSGIQNRLSATSSATSEPTLHSIGLDGNFEKDDDPRTRHCVSEMRGASRSISHPELCIVGQGLQ
ncbi:photoreceptor cilium actin regulator-like [Chiloscyllium plagiosum]|uniref:photoreceptor cilium actin regulator-like n=1 Tax=Chiloscyllium plagiosum TaxID=36176 RepID=UPI001CB7D965|nr:photoreceptor cilium actin regulator-like [Chiloscyllium plagiosum]